MVGVGTRVGFVADETLRVSEGVLGTSGRDNCLTS